MKSDRFRILLVCEGNVCRSALAAALLRDAFRAVSGIEIVSAGTRAMEGHRMPAEALAIAERLGVGADAERHVGVQLTADAIREADLVLTATLEQRAAVVELEPRGLRRTFALREFAYVGGELPVEQIDEAVQAAVRSELTIRTVLRAVTAQVGMMRGAVAPPPDGGFDIIDPYRQEAAVYEQSAEQTVAAVQPTIATLKGALERAGCAS